MSICNSGHNALPPLAERMRPVSLDNYIGQEHLTGADSVLRKTLLSGKIPSMILWGPPGVGKTTLAFIISRQLTCPFHTLSAVSSGVKEVREVIEKAQQTGFAFGNPVLFIDEIHRFSKSQQDSLLGAVEKGTVTLIGATTENPSFEVISPLLSRCQVYVLKELGKEQLLNILQFAVTHDELLKKKNIKIHEHEALLHLSGGDARKMLNLFELVVGLENENSENILITDEKVMQCAQQTIALYDKGGEQHYDIISAFIKSVRGSDPNAAVYWLARMLKGGEDIKFIARRLVILASEDIGNANPTALVLATNCFQAVNMLGMPEAQIILSQTTAYLASSPKSNSAVAAIMQANSIVEKTGDLPVPLHLRNAPTRLMREMNYGKNYQYSHDFENNFSQQEYMPEAIKETKIYEPGNNVREKELRIFLKSLWKEKYWY